ncbi:MAG TPA: patatin family protein [Dehalococcoidia bacterium]|nr:patatin family protein [Dehalococcoidia bacterium]
MAHIGVLEVLEKEGIPINMIAGTSAGAAIGALYAQGKSARQIKELATEIGWVQFFSLVDLALPRSGFIEGTKIKKLLQSIIGDIDFSDLSIPMACVATDIESGEEVVINQGPVLEGVRASISVPVIFTAVKRDDRYLVDGGLVNPVPVSTVREMGADFVIAVNVVPPMGAKSRRKSKKPKQPGMFHVMLQSIYIASYAMVKTNLEEADIVIEPRLPNIGFGDFHRTRECIAQGELAALTSIAEIKKRLGE